ncbi:MAG: hypothetical protein KA174_10025 [Chitinophagales bacterium]|nr:hypothetical protein [Chitinophagales bacterium]
MRSILFFFSFVLLATKLYGQTPVNFDECKTDEFYVSVEQQPLWADTSKTIKEYFFQYFEVNHSLESANGKIVLNILIYSSGQPCCRAFTDMNKTGLNPQIFKDAVNKMPLWIPAKQKNREVPFMYMVLLQLKDGMVLK